MTYYDNAYRVTRDGVPCRVFQRRDAELSAQIAAIEIASAAGCDLELDDAPGFSFMPAERAADAEPRSCRAGRPSAPKPPKGNAYYEQGTRVIIKGVPCRLGQARAPNHSLSHWADGEPMGGHEAWAERAAQWWAGIEESRGETPAPEPVEIVEELPAPEPEPEPKPKPIMPAPLPLAAELRADIRYYRQELSRSYRGRWSNAELSAWYRQRIRARIAALRPRIVPDVAPEPEPASVSPFPPYSVTSSLGDAGQACHYFHTLGEALAAAQTLYIERRHPTVRGPAGLIITPHRGKAPMGEKPRQWSFSQPSPDGYKTAATICAERAGIRYASHRQGYQASGLAIRRFAALWDAPAPIPLAA